RCSIAVRRATAGGLGCGDGHGHRLGGGERTEAPPNGRIERGNLGIPKNHIGQVHRPELLLVGAGPPPERLLSDGDHGPPTAPGPTRPWSRARRARPPRPPRSPGSTPPSHR